MAAVVTVNRDRSPLTREQTPHDSRSAPLAIARVAEARTIRGDAA